MDFSQGAFYSIDQVAQSYVNVRGNARTQVSSTDSQLSFSQILSQKALKSEKQNSVVFSKHANERLADRNITLNETQMDRLNEGVKQAKEKSINESLVMMDNIAFIVNVKNNTVITAMDQETNDNNVFTNIDGAVIV